MYKSAPIVRNIDHLPTSLSIETLEEIVRNCQRNEQRLHELERHTRHERKKAEHLLRETYRTLHDRDNRPNVYREQYTRNHENRIDVQRPIYRPSKKFFVL